MKDKGFRQIDTEYFKALMSADLTRSGYKILLVVIHFTLGYQRDAADISLTTFQNLTKLSRPAVKTAIRDLIAYGLISQASSATNRLPAIYKLNKDWGGEVDLPPRGQAGLPSKDVSSPISDAETISPGMSKTYPPDVQNLPPRGQVPMPVTTPLKKERKPLKKTNNDPFDAEWVLLSEQIIDYYFKVYRKHEGKVHPALKPEQKQRVIAELWRFADDKAVIDLEDFKTMINWHFKRKLQTDWNINHFATEGILENAHYKNLY